MHLRLSSRVTHSPVLWFVGPAEFGKSGGPGRVVARVAARESFTTTAWRIVRYGFLPSTPKVTGRRFLRTN